MRQQNATAYRGGTRATKTWMLILLCSALAHSLTFAVALEGSQVSPAAGPLRPHPDNTRNFADNSGRVTTKTGSHTWQRWEFALTSTRSYANPYADATLRVTYTGPDKRTIRSYGFWDSGDIFRIRCAFPVPGTWQWQTECSDASNTGLQGQRGSIDVLPYYGDNMLYRHGFLKVSDNRRYLAFGDATPFLWIGDTAWAVPQKASPEEWEQYLADRAAKHFTVIQVAPAPEWAGERDRQGQRPFTDKTCGQWNPAYWQSFERKVQRANECGFVVMLVGLMEPVARYPESTKACLFARNIVARLFGNFVVFSPSFDSAFLPLANEVGRATRDATVVHLVTQHLHDFLAGIEWWRLEPAHNLIGNQPGDVTRRMVLAKSTTGDLAVGYLPDNEAIEVSVSAFPAPVVARWFDPVSGRYTDIAGIIDNNGTHRFTPPARGDWVLLLRKNSN